MQDSALQVISAYSHYKQTYALSVMRFVSSRNCNRLFLRLWNISAANAHWQFPFILLAVRKANNNCSIV